jgi:carboxypeptidase Taq
MSAYSDLLDRYRDLQALDAAGSLLGWDQQVLMPPSGAEARIAHQGIFTRLEHEIRTSDEMRGLLERAEREAEPNSDEAAAVRALRRDVEIATKLPLELVERKARVSAHAYETWKVAKAESDFLRLAPFLEELFAIARETAQALGYSDHPYDPLVDLYEEGATQADVERMFSELREPIVALVREIRERGAEVDDASLFDEWDQPKLRDAAQEIAREIGFDFGRGRLDLARNAFCSTISVGDVRMTTRPSEHLKGVLSSSLHEMGHGLYEQGSPPEWDRTPLQGGISLAVHESQSRLWENIIGRSRPFWQHFLPKLQARFPRLDAYDVDGFYRAYSRVNPTFIRVGADELTYNLHILIRYELEVELVTERLRVKDLPEAWNARYESYLGIVPPNDALGVLQDVHWSRGSVGYFPTYVMGNLIGAQVWRKLRDEVEDVEGQMARGHFGPILEWLRERIYRQGRCHRPADLVVSVTGSPMQTGDFLHYLDAKFREIYRL